MEQQLLYLLGFAGVAAVVAAAMVAAGWLLGPRRSTPVKGMPYESGMDPVHPARRRFDVRFYVVALVFLIFDVELLFLYPWAVARRHADGFARLAPDARLVLLGEFLLFMGLLAAALAYAWRRGALRWR